MSSPASRPCAQDVYDSITGAEDLAIEAMFGRGLDAMERGIDQLRAAQFRQAP